MGWENDPVSLAKQTIQYQLDYEKCIATKLKKQTCVTWLMKSWYLGDTWFSQDSDEVIVEPERVSEGFNLKQLWYQDY